MYPDPLCYDLFRISFSIGHLVSPFDLTGDTGAQRFAVADPLFDFSDGFLEPRHESFLKNRQLAGNLFKLFLENVHIDSVYTETLVEFYQSLCHIDGPVKYSRSAEKAVLGNFNVYGRYLLDLDARNDDRFGAGCVGNFRHMIRQGRHIFGLFHRTGYLSFKLFDPFDIFLDLQV